MTEQLDHPGRWWLVWGEFVKGTTKRPICYGHHCRTRDQAVRDIDGLEAAIEQTPECGIAFAYVFSPSGDIEALRPFLDESARFREA